MTNLSATSAHLDFHTHGYHSQLSAPSAQPADSSIPTHTPTEGELESYVPSLPTGWAKGVAPTAKSIVAASGAKDQKKEKQKKRRHRLPKGAVEGKPFTEDVSYHVSVLDCTLIIDHVVLTLLFRTTSPQTRRSSLFDVAFQCDPPPA